MNEDFFRKYPAINYGVIDYGVIGGWTQFEESQENDGKSNVFSTGNVVGPGVCE